MPKLTIRGVKPLSVTLRGRAGGFMTTLVVTADLSKPVVKAMGWEDLLLDGDSFRDTWESIDLTSAIGAGDGVFKPNGNEGGELVFKFDQISKFKATKTESEGDKKPTLELQFKVRISTKGAAGALEKFWQKNQGVASQMQIEFSEQAAIPAGDTEAGETTASGGLED